MIHFLWRIVLCQHFRKEDHSFSDIRVQIIYQYTGKDEDAEEVLLHVEDFYMKKLVTVMPFGLNDHITDLNINLSSDVHQLFNRDNTRETKVRNLYIFR